jgi:hypothetical protein
LIDEIVDETLGVGEEDSLSEEIEEEVAKVQSASAFSHSAGVR